jgi:hypothetical protein
VSQTQQVMPPTSSLAYGQSSLLVLQRDTHVIERDHFVVLLAEAELV